MNKFCVITNRDKDENYTKAQSIAEYIEGKGGVCHILDNKRAEQAGVRHFTRLDEIPRDVQCALVLGGDGTMIQAAIDLVHRSLPILGINLGTVGFLTEVEQQNLEKALDKAMTDCYILEDRIMLRETMRLCQTEEGQRENLKSCYALNDVVVSKRGLSRLVTIRVTINGELADIYRADGLIVSTPTGSTGYNLSAGGPVMVPHTQATVITPICAHSLNKRSLVLSTEDRITLEIGQTKETQKDTAMLVVDGRNVGELSTGDCIDISVPRERTQLVKLSDISFYKRMREKLNGN